MYSTRIPELGDEPVEFGTSGLLYRSNKLMYDRATETLWRQFTGEPVVGELAHSGIVLNRLPIVVTTWGEWLSDHPDTTVLSNETGVYPPSLYFTEEDPQAIYNEYFNSPGTMFPVWVQSEALPAKEPVVGVVVVGVAKAYPTSALQQQGVIHDAIGDARIVVVPTPDGHGGRVFAVGDVTFDAGSLEDNDGERLLRDGRGRRWLIGEEALVLAEDLSMRLPRLPSHNAFWFGWYSNYPNSLLWRPG